MLNALSRLINYDYDINSNEFELDALMINVYLINMI